MGATSIVVQRLRAIYGGILVGLFETLMRQSLNDLFFARLMAHTSNFSKSRWNGLRIQQNTFDIWVTQETIFEVRPALIVECGTNEGGSALFYANLMDLIGHGKVLTIDIRKNHQLDHPRIRAVTGDSLSREILAIVEEECAAASGPVLVILDDDHSAAHVRKELDVYTRFVSPGSFLLCQDGVVDTHQVFAELRPGPLPAIQDFVSKNSDFEVDIARVNRFPLTHHPMGWLRRRR